MGSQPAWTAVLHFPPECGFSRKKKPPFPRGFPSTLYPHPTPNPPLPRSITGLQSGLYSLVTPTLALAGAAYLFMPSATLGTIFG